MVVLCLHDKSSISENIMWRRRMWNNLMQHWVLLKKSPYLLQRYTNILMDEMVCCLGFTSQSSGLGELDLSRIGYVLIIIEAK